MISNPVGHDSFAFEKQVFQEFPAPGHRSCKAVFPSAVTTLFGGRMHPNKKANDSNNKYFIVGTR